MPRPETLALIQQSVAALLYSLGAVAMKASDGLRRPWPTLALFAAFGAGAALHALGMRRTEMGVAYIFVIGLEAVIAFALAAAIFGEPVRAAKLAGVALVVGGIVLLHR